MMGLEFLCKYGAVVDYGNMNLYLHVNGTPYKIKLDENIKDICLPIHYHKMINLEV